MMDGKVEVVVGLTISKLPVGVGKIGQNRIWLQGEETRMLLYRCKVPSRGYVTR